MAKSKAGLPEGFDLRVNSQELVHGPASLPGYLDERPKYFAEPKVMVSTPTEDPKPAVSEEATISLSPIKPAIKVVSVNKPKPSLIRRCQINLTAETERKVDELIDLVSEQSPDKRVTASELFQALILALHDSRGEINLGRLPVRGRWGSPTAKSFPTALSQLFREALVRNSERKGGDPFRKAVGV